MSERVTGQALTIQFDGQKCIHSRNCVLSLPQVFRANVEGPWIHPDAASPDAVAALAARCPSGAIVVERHDGVPDELPSGRNVIAVLESGPYAVRGELSINGDRALRATLCRCGASKNKPYCDTSHVEAGFTATGENTPEALGWLRFIAIYGAVPFMLIGAWMIWNFPISKAQASAQAAELSARRVGAPEVGSAQAG